MSNVELRVCNHVHLCDYGRKNMGGFCTYAKPMKENKSVTPMSGHCIAVSGMITMVPIDKGHKNKDPNVSFRIDKLVKELGIN